MFNSFCLQISVTNVGMTKLAMDSLHGSLRVKSGMAIFGRVLLKRIVLAGQSKSWKHLTQLTTG